ncbi:MAG: T9SS type A sorting domain-containing protein, partial [Calditrichaeota bacterium]|nr:T9SS type A sorting domain-containing protein [Calditrichota bacterium]
VIQSPNRDILKIYELWPRRAWLSVSPRSGQLAGGGANTALTIQFDASYFLQGVRQAEIEIHDIMRGEVIPVTTILTTNGGPAVVQGLVRGDREADWSRTILTLNNRVIYNRVDQEGAFRIENLFPGRYRLRADLAGFLPFVSDSFNLAANEVRGFDIQLRHLPVGYIEGIVESVYDTVLAGVEVSAIGADGRAAGIDTTEANGFYSILLPQGVYRVVTRLTGWRAAPVLNVQVRDNERTRVNIEMDDRLAVRALRTDGRFDDRILLSWLPAGVDGEAVVLSHDAGPAANAIYMRDRWDIVATRFEPPGECDITGLSVRIDRDWPDAWDDAIYLYVFAEDPNTGLPGDSLTSILVNQHIGNNLEWVSVPTRGLRFISRPFFVGFRQIHNPRWLEDYEAVSLDGRLDYPDAHFLRLSGNWLRFNELPGDLMVRATIWSYREHNQQQLAPGRMINADANVNADGDADADYYVLKNHNSPISDDEIIYSPYFDNLSSSSSSSSSLSSSSFVQESPGRGLPPRRDPPLRYKVLVNGEVAAEDALGTQWEHIIGSENENREYTYQVVAVYADGTEIESPAAVGRANIAPSSVRSLQIGVNGLNYTVGWAAPLVNADGTNCVDYAGCEIFLDGQALATVQAPITRYEGRLQEGQDGWHTLRFTAFDEVPNRSTPVDTLVALGNGILRNFEPVVLPDRYVEVLTGSPFGAWQRSASMGNPNAGTGPGRAHSGRYAWATRPAQGRYDNNAEWLLTTVNEYFVASQSSRVEFYHFYAFEAGHDGGQLQISVDNGPWSLLTPVGGYPDQTVGAFGNEPAWTGANGDWRLVTADLAPYVGHGVKLRWRFKSDDAINWYCGWFIDDLIFWGANQAEYAQVSGFVRDAAGGFVAGANISTARGSAISAQNGAYRIQNLLPGLLTFTASKSGWRSDEHRVNLNARDSLRLDFDLSRPVVTLEPDSVSFALGGNDEVETAFIVANEDDVPLAYRLRVTPPGGWRDAQRLVRDVDSDAPRRDRPWDALFNFNLTSAFRLSRVMGAEFAGGKFFITAADTALRSVVCIISEDGRLLRTVVQPQQRLVGWGLRDLATDGQRLYGSQDSMITAFDLNGALTGTQRGAPLTVNRALAYDPDANGFWATEWDQPWFLIDREGRVQFRWDRHGLTGVYGFAYYPADPDGLCLWALNLEANGETGIYRADPRNARLELVRRLPGAPTGAFVTGDWDFGRWTLGAVLGSNPQRLIGYEIAPRIAWLTVSPLEGEIAADAQQEFVLNLAVPAEARQGDRYSADIALWAENGAQTVLPVRLEIVEGFRHFEAPAELFDFMTINIEQATLRGAPLPIGSEIAAATPQGVVGGVARWLQRPVDLLAYVGRGAFDNWSSIRFLVWDCRANREYEARAEFIQGLPFIQSGERSVVRLRVEPPLELTINLTQGWNLISSYVRPNDLVIRNLLGGVHQRQRLILMKDGAGRFWAPAWGFSNLGPWNPLWGYQINVSAAESFIVVGERIPPDQPIPLAGGWNMIAYLFDHPVDTRVALEDILDAVLIIKNGIGQFAVPALNYYGLQRMLPTQGYKIKVRSAVELIYNPGELTASIEPPAGGETGVSTGSDMSLLIIGLPASLSPEAEILVHTNGELDTPIGCSKLNSTPLGIILRGDDPTTAARDGALNGDALSLIIRDGGRLFAAAYNLISGEMVWTEDGLTILEIKGLESLPEEFTLSSVYPNPFNARTIVKFGLALDGIIRMKVLDACGRTVFESGNERLSAGWYERSIDGAAWASGIYMLEIAAADKIQRQKIVLMR